MSYNVVFTTQADIDLHQAISWYEKQRDLLGWEYREDISRTIDKIMDDRVSKVFRKYQQDKADQVPIQSILSERL
jgi:hypothetical protein